MTAPHAAVGSGSLAEAVDRARRDLLAAERAASRARLQIFRAYLAAAVRSMNALLPDVLDLAQMDVATIARRIGPSPKWERHAGVRSGTAGIFAVRSKPARGQRRLRNAGMLDAHQHAHKVGSAIGADGALNVWIEVVAVERSLEVILDDEAFRLTTAAGVARISVRGLLPDVVLAALPGRPVVDVVDHPLLRDRGFVVSGVGRGADRTTIEFEVGELPISIAP